MPSYLDGTGTGSKTGFFGNLFSKNNFKSLLSGFNQIGGNNLSNMPNGVEGMYGDNMDEAEIANAKIGQGISSGINGVLQFNNINNSGLNSSQKTMARADAGLDTISSFASMIPGIGGVIGGALGGLNKLGGALIGNPKIVKDYVQNDEVAASSGYGGVANLASEGARSAESYKSSGLVGKLFGKNKVKNELTKANAMQNRVSDTLRTNKTLFDRAASSSDLFSTNNKNKLYNTGNWMNGSVMFGKNGMTINFKRLAKSARKGVSKTITEEKSPVEQVKMHKNGGSLSVIVDGKLHAHKHNLKELDKFKDAEITEKGVAVVTLSEGGEVITQHAEVEKDELVCHKALTIELELLHDKGDEEAMIAAGKLLAEELVKNTRDSKSKILKNA